jgi:hypothetical protein
MLSKVTWFSLFFCLLPLFLGFFAPFLVYESSPNLPCLEEFGASGLAWRRIVEEKIVEELWKYLVNAAPED